jgi:guanylate kinase
LSVLASRLLKRGDSIDQIEKRLKLAQIEREQEIKEQLFHFKIINDNLENSVKEIEQLIKGQLG